ncbi:MAG TPA: PIN domain-containing protein [Flavisolibacter sp.]|jgi:predicted nucleic acid-binding protein|nr:PIN domain-containing protein [Flavisolibacter sp.]
MASKVFLDANVLLDFLLQRQQADSAKTIIAKAVEGKISAFITPSVLHIAGYWLSKEYGSAKAKQLLTALLADVQVIDCNHAIATMALQSTIDDIEDALQYFTAIEHKLTHFISSDKKLKQAAIPQLPVFTPAEFLHEWEE